MTRIGSGYGRRIDFLREQAARLGLSKDEARKFGNLSKVVTWERAIAHALKTAPMQLARLPQSQTRLLNPPKIICPTCLGVANCKKQRSKLQKGDF